MQGCQPDVAIFNSMIAACAHGGEHVKARAMFDCMTDHGCQPDAVTYANLIRAFKKVGHGVPVRSRLGNAGSLAGAPLFDVLAGCLAEVMWAMWLQAAWHAGSHLQDCCGAQKHIEHRGRPCLAALLQVLTKCSGCG